MNFQEEGSMSSASVASAVPGDEPSRLMDHEPRLVLVHAADDPPMARAPEPVMLRAQQAAAQAGVHLGEIERLPFDLSALESEGAFVNVDARNFGLLDRRLDWRALGVTLPRRGDLAFRPPRCGLVPDRYRLPLLRPASRAHVALHKFSYQFRLVETVFETPSYRWVPWRAWPDFEREFEVAQSRLRAALQTYERDYALIRETVTEAMNTTKQPSRFQRLVLASGAALAIAGFAVGFTGYSVLKPTE